MKSFEALFTLLVILSFSFLILNYPEPKLNDSLYRFQLANDVWRIWQLRGDLDGFNEVKMTADADYMTQLTGFCIYLVEEQVASCTYDETIISSIQKKAWINGEIKTLTLVLAKS
jgi:hypothetical protein